MRLQDVVVRNEETEKSTCKDIGGKMLLQGNAREPDGSGEFVGHPGNPAALVVAFSHHRRDRKSTDGMAGWEATSSDQAGWEQDACRLADSSSSEWAGFSKDSCFGVQVQVALFWAQELPSPSARDRPLIDSRRVHERIFIFCSPAVHVRASRFVAGRRGLMLVSTLPALQSRYNERS